MLQVLRHFAVLPDPRSLNARHGLAGIMLIATAATLAGPKTCVETAELCEARETLLRRVLELEHGIPSRDSFSCVLRTLDPAAFGTILASFATAFGAVIQRDDVIAVDGSAREKTREHGLVASKSGASRNIRRMVPPLCLSEHDVDAVADAMGQCFAGY